MALFLIKNFTGMTQIEIEETHVHYGAPEVTTRTFPELIGRECTSTKEEKLLQEILDELDHGEKPLEFPLNELLRVECGAKLRLVKDLPEDVLHYLRNTPHDIMWTEYLKVVQLVHSIFENRLADME